MKNFVRRFAALSLSVIMIFCIFSGCSEPESTDTTTESETTTTQKEEEEVILTDYNRLTGLDDLSDEAKGKRPVAIMVNNIRKSLPQYGIAAADLMFECLVEGGITRLMAVYSDYTKVPNVCSVRSCRYYYPILAYGLDAVYFCFGSNPTLGTPTLKKLNIDYFNASENYDELVFGRDQNRLKTYSREHTAYVKGSKIPELYKKYDIRTDYKEGKDTYIFDFREPGEFKKVSKISCDKVKLDFSKSYNSTFTYDSEKKVYFKQHTGKAHIDSATGEQLSYTNVFVLETEVELYNGGPLVKINWKGGTGYYISAGTVKEIKWSKKSEAAGIVIKDTNGKSVKVNPGKSYIGIIGVALTTLSSNGQAVSFTAQS